MTIAYDLFAGAGGASLGLIEAGYDVLGFEWWDRAVETHRSRVGPCAQVDLSTFDWSTQPTPRLMWGSPPCQPFSAAGDGLGADDERDGLPWWERALAELLPPVAIMENVKGLTFAKHRPHLDAHLRRVRALGYDVSWRVLNSADYGVPQTRQRLFVICRRDGGPITWPTVTHTREAGMFTEWWVSMADALGWGFEERPALTVAGGSEGHGGGADLAGGSGARRAYRQMLVTERQANGARRTGDEPAPTVTASMDNGNLRRLNRRQSEKAGTSFRVTDRPSAAVTTEAGGQWVWDRPATTIAADVRVFAPGHHDEHTSGSQGADAIPVTIAELATLQDFPPGFTFCGTKSDQARQVGNAVPRRLARLLAEANHPIKETP